MKNIKIKRSPATPLQNTTVYFQEKESVPLLENREVADTFNLQVSIYALVKNNLSFKQSARIHQLTWHQRNSMERGCFVAFISLIFTLSLITFPYRTRKSFLQLKFATVCKVTTEESLKRMRQAQYQLLSELKSNASQATMTSVSRISWCNMQPWHVSAIRRTHTYPAEAQGRLLMWMQSLWMSQSMKEVLTCYVQSNKHQVSTSH